MSGHVQGHSSSSLGRKLAVLLAIFAGLIVLVFRPFGYKMFQIELQQHNILALILVLGIVAVILVILQQLGIIFADYTDK